MEAVSEEPAGHLGATHLKSHQDATNPRGLQHPQANRPTRDRLNTKVTALVGSKGRALQLPSNSGNLAEILDWLRSPF